MDEGGSVVKLRGLVIVSKRLTCIFRGWGVQWTDNGGRCGVCGDPWSALPRQHEAPGGKFATGEIRKM